MKEGAQVERRVHGGIREGRCGEISARELGHSRPPRGCGT